MKTNDDVEIVYPSEEKNNNQFQNRKSDSFTPVNNPTTIQQSWQQNILNQNGKIEKLSHCQQNLGCISQFMCSDRPFDYGSDCEFSTWIASDPDFGKAWSFNAAAGKCQSFRYGGCDGSLNVFKTRMECENCKPNINIMYQDIT